PYSYSMKPVTLPPGRASVSTKPAPTRSATCTNTIGTVRVACSSGSVVALLTARMTSGASATNSATPGPLQKQTYAVQQTVSQVLAVIDRSAVGELPLNSYSSSKTRIHVYKHRFMYMG